MTRRWPCAPFLELGFYFQDVPYHLALTRVVGVLRSMGGSVVLVSALRGEGVRDRPFSSSWTGLEEEHPGAETLEPWSVDPDRRVTRVALEGGTRVVPRSQEVVAVIETAEETSVHPIALWLDGSVFSLPTPRGAVAARARLRRAEAAQRALIERLDPSYSGITVYCALPTPAALLREGRAFGVHGLYVSSKFTTTEHATRLRELEGRSELERVGSGWRVSPSSLLPEGAASTADLALELTAAITARARLARPR